MIEICFYEVIIFKEYDIRNLSEEEYQKQINCMKYNFGVEIKKDFQSFQYYIENGKDNEEKKGEEKKEEEKKEEEKKEDEDENISPLLRKLKKDKKKEKVGQTNLKDLKSKEMSDGSCMNILRKFKRRNKQFKRK